MTPSVEGSWDNKVLFQKYTQIPGEGIGLKVLRLAARQQIRSQKLHFLNTVGDTLPPFYTNAHKWQACTAISSSLASWNILREGQLLDDYHLDYDQVWQISHNFNTVKGCILWPCLLALSLELFTFDHRLNQRFSSDEVLQLLDRFFNLEHLVSNAILQAWTWAELISCLKY